MADTITAIARLLWPVLVIVGLLVFRGPLVQVVRSFERRKMIIEVGGQKLTIDELSAQQITQIADLQEQLGAVHQALEVLAAAQSTPVDLPETPGTVSSQVPRGAVRLSISDTFGSLADKPFAVLWVDDYPENNALLVERLRQNGVRVDLARSTQEGLRLFSQRRYRVILSDMGRFEDGTDAPDAGLRLLTAIRQMDQSIPFLILSSSRAVRNFGHKALSAGATKVTASAYQITEDLRALELL